MIKIVKYSEKAIAIFGEETKNIKEDIKAIGGRFNRFLKNPENENEKLAGWILSTKKLDKIVDVLTGLGVEFENKV